MDSNIILVCFFVTDDRKSEPEIGRCIGRLPKDKQSAKTQRNSIRNQEKSTEMLYNTSPSI